jgi:hypothetical protein
MLAAALVTLVSFESSSTSINARGGGLLTTKRNKFSHLVKELYLGLGQFFAARYPAASPSLTG